MTRTCRRALSVIATSLVSMSIAQSLGAQDGRAAVVLDPVVTTATGDARKLSDVGWAVSVADSAALARGPTVGLGEALGAIPGVQATSRWGTEDVNIGIRGSAARAAATPGVRGVAVLLDGITLTEPDGLARLDMIELADARQVEVVRGPASALYPGASGGVVNVVSRTGRDSPGVTLRAQGGAFGLRKYAGRAGGALGDGRMSGLAAASYTSIDGYRTHSDANVFRAHAAADYEWADARVGVEVTGSRLTSQLPGALTEGESDLDPRAAAPAATLFSLRRGDDRFRAGVRMEKAIRDGGVEGNVFYGGRTLDLAFPGGVLDLNLHRTQGGVQLRSGRITRLRLHAAAGADFDDQRGPERLWNGSAGTRSGGLIDDGSFDERLYSGYGQLEWQAAASVAVTLGARYDRLTYRFASETPGAVPRQEQTFDQLSPRVGATWRPDSVTSLYASIGRGIEFPIIGEISDYAGAPLGKARPKSLWNYEVGARRRVGSRVRIEAATFVAQVRGEFVPITIDGMELIENASRSRNRGVEVGATAALSPRLELAGSYTLLDLRLQDYTTTRMDSSGTSRAVNFAGRRMPAVPRQRLTGAVQVRPVPALTLGAEVEWQDVVYVETSNVRQGVWYVRGQPDAPVQQVPFGALPARALARLSAAYQLGAATVFGGVDNVTNQRYAGNVAANDALGRFYFPGSPRSASVGLSIAAAHLPKR